MTVRTAGSAPIGLPARPYGWIGLPLSLVAILALGTALSALVTALAFGVEVAITGWSEGVKRASGLLQAVQGDPHTAEFIGLCGSILIYLAVAIAVVAAARFRGGPAWRDLIGWHPWYARQGRRFFWMLAGITLLYSVAANQALVFFYPPSKDWVTMPTGAPSIALFFIVATVSAPLTEELIFRGWIFTALRAKLSLWPSLLVSSALFALAHWESTHLYALVVFPVGIALGLIRERARSLKASIAFHALFNGTAFLLMVFGM